MAGRPLRARARQNNIPPDVLNVMGVVTAVVAVVLLGAGFASVLPQGGAPWLVAAAYGAPAGLAFLAYWWAAQRL